jgi:hypothetical protein
MMRGRWTILMSVFLSVNALAQTNDTVYVDAKKKLILKDALNKSKRSFVMINNVPYNGSLNTIDSDSIVDVRVMKAADAKVLYGNKAANGAIMIKTKSYPVKYIPVNVPCMPGIH